MTQKRRKRCPHCGFLDTIKRGKRAGYSRYFVRIVIVILPIDDHP